MAEYYDEIDSENEQTVSQHRLLQAEWFLRSVIEGPVKTKEHRQVAIAALQLLDQVTPDMVEAKDAEVMIANALHAGSANQAEIDTVREILTEFGDYYDAMPNVFSRLPYATMTPEEERYEIAYMRLDAFGRHWSQNLNFYRGTSMLRPTSTFNDAARGFTQLTVDDVLDDIQKVESASDLLKFIEDERLFDQLVPTIDGKHLGLQPHHCSQATHPLAPHEVFWLTRDPCFLDRLKRMVVEVCRAFGLTELPGEGPGVTFEVEQNQADRDAVWKWMSSDAERTFQSRLLRLCQLLTHLNRRVLFTSVLLGVLSIPGFSGFFADFLEDRVYPLCNSTELNKVRRLLRDMEYGGVDDIDSI